MTQKRNASREVIAASGRAGATSSVVPSLDMAPPMAKARPQQRRAARVAAVQALYQQDVTGVSADLVVTEFVMIRMQDNEAAQEGLDPDLDRGLFAQIVRGVADSRETVDGLLAASLSEDWTVARLEKVLRAILRAGAFELLRRPEVPPNVVINEYVDISHGFFTQREPSLVNAVLDRIAKAVRVDEKEPADRPSVEGGPAGEVE